MGGYNPPDCPPPGSLWLSVGAEGPGGAGWPLPRSPRENLAARMEPAQFGNLGDGQNPARFSFNDGIHKMTIPGKQYCQAETFPHCKAIAEAIPEKVRLLCFHRSGEGGSFQIRFSRPLTIFVGRNFGRFFNHRQVVFVSPWPNCQG